MQLRWMQPRAAGVQGSRRALPPPSAVGRQEHSPPVQRQVRSTAIRAVRARCSAGCWAAPRAPLTSPHPALLRLQGLEAQRPAEQQNGALRIEPDHRAAAAAAEAAPAAQDAVGLRSADSTTAARPQRLQLHYRTRWEQPILHHSLAGGEWQGLPMQRVSRRRMAT